MHQNIFLVGLMGAGKTTVGRALAKRLGMRFVDSDHEIEARTGATIPLIFEIEGEASFRRREAEVIRDLTAQRGIVLATGGGAVIDPENRQFLKTRGTVIYLRASVSNILHRTMHDRNRPLLQTPDPRRKIEELTQQREPYYREIADIVIDTGRPNVLAMVQSIMAQLVPGRDRMQAVPKPGRHQSNLRKEQMTEKAATIHLQAHSPGRTQLMFQPDAAIADS